MAGRRGWPSRRGKRENEMVLGERQELSVRITLNPKRE